MPQMRGDRIFDSRFMTSIEGLYGTPGRKMKTPDNLFLSGVPVSVREKLRLDVVCLAVGYDVKYAYNGHVVLQTEGYHLRQSGHGAVIIGELAENAAWI